jgi:hypothetical protein
MKWRGRDVDSRGMARRNGVTVLLHTAPQGRRVAGWTYPKSPWGRAVHHGDREFIKGAIMSLFGRIESLKERHTSLEMRIADEGQRPRPDSETLARLKLEKLRLKEEMDRLQNQGRH